jgi:SAM-dependent methyltransferase
MSSWWQTFFDADYLRIWEGAEAEGNADRQVDGLWSLLGLQPEARILDAPCGYGRISQLLAERGALVLGVDASSEMLDEAERRRGGVSEPQLRYLRHDLREPLHEGGFDAALNLFSSLGYGSEADDLAVLSTLRDAVRPGGFVFVETNHRDRHIARMISGESTATRLPDGTLLLEEPRFDPVAGRVDTTWYWSGPAGTGQKNASIRVYTLTELVRLLEITDLQVQSVHRGCFPEPFLGTGAGVGNRVGIIATRGE